MVTVLLATTQHPVGKHQPRPMPTKNSSARHTHRSLLREKGYSIRSAAKPLGVDFSHLSRVLSGERNSATLLRKIERLTPKARTAQ